MKVWGLTIAQVHEATGEASLSYFGGNVSFNRSPEQTGRAVSFTLRVDSSKGPGARRSHRGRRLVSACWHVHLEVMRALFSLGATRIQSAMSDYHSAKDLEDMKWGSYRRNVGSIMEPAQYGHLCDCSDWRAQLPDRHVEDRNVLVATRDPESHKVTFGTLTQEGGLQNVRQIRQADIAKCPHVIFVPEHYQADGSCRCNDASHTEMKDWGYTWDGVTWQAKGGQRRMTHTLKFGDRVAYSREFLQSAGALTGDLPFARGTVKAIEYLGESVLARIHWDMPGSAPDRVNVENLVLVSRIPFESR